MINNKIFLVSLPILVLVLVLPAAAQDQYRQEHPYGFLDLTEEQLGAIQEQRLAFQKDILSLRTKLMTGYMELDNLYLESAEQAKIEGKISELDQLELELDKQFETHQQQIRSQLTEDQKVLFDRFGGLGMGPAFGMGYGAGLRAGYGRGWGRGSGWGAGRGAWTSGAARNRSVRYRDSYTRNSRYGRVPARGYSRDMGYTRAPARGLGRGTARAGAAYRIRTTRDARDFGRSMRYWFPRCWRWR